jgi:hypothetical protein
MRDGPRSRVPVLLAKGRLRRAMIMDLRQLEYFLRVAQRKNISLAAADLGCVCPKDVSATARGRRSNNFTPNSSSRSLMLLVRVGCAMTAA